MVRNDDAPVGQSGSCRAAVGGSQLQSAHKVVAERRRCHATRGERGNALLVVLHPIQFVRRHIYSDAPAAECGPGETHSTRAIGIEQVGGYLVATRRLKSEV